MNAPVRIAVVEDHADTRSMITTFLSAYYDVTAFAAVRDLLRGLESKSYELILSDLLLPEMDGFDLVAILRNDERYRSIPVIAVTASGPRCCQQALQAGFTAYLTKPCDFDDLLRTIRSHLRDES